MNKDIIKGNWKVIKGNVKQQWGKLTDDDLTKMEGSFEELSGILQKRYGLNKDMAKKEIDTFIKTHKLDVSSKDVNLKQETLSRTERQDKDKKAA